MRRLLFLSLCLGLLPLKAVALEYQNLSILYTDAPFPPSEAAGISLLTGLGAVEGNPDGTFRPRRTLNRAEFLKIALISHPRIRVSPSDADRCFPDVNQSDWFSKYVCIAKKRGMVAGYPDGLFRPANAVNYAEALKILGELYDYIAWSAPDEEWYMGYVRAAQFHKTFLPIALDYDRFLTRGQMARLAAAFRAEWEGEIDLYRRAERGEFIVAKEEVVEEEDEEGLEEEEPAPPEPEEEEASPTPDLPASSKLLLLGERSKPIADGTFFPALEQVKIRSVKVEMKEEARTFDALFLVDASGTEIGELSLDITDQEDKTWRVNFDASGAYLLPERQGTILAVEAQVKGRGDGGFSEELLKVKKFILTVGSMDDTQSYELIPSDAHYPYHQTVEGFIDHVENALSGTGVLQSGNDQLMAAFSISAHALSGTSIRIEHLTFTVDSSSNTNVSDWELGKADEATRHSCSVEADDGIVNCLNVPASLGMINSSELQLYGDVSVGIGTAHLQVNLQLPGSTSEMGAIRWTDESGHFQWIEADEPLAEGRWWE